MRVFLRRTLIGLAIVLSLVGAACFLWYSPYSPYQYGQYIPADLDDAHAQLMKSFPAKELERISGFKSEDDMIEYHFGLGMGIRNDWGLWLGSRLARYFNTLGIHHPDDMSGVILNTFWCKLHNKPIDLEGIAIPYRKEWQVITLSRYLEHISMGEPKIEDMSVEAVIEIFEKKFQEYLKEHPEARRELPKTLFVVRASRACLQQKVTFNAGNDSSLWNGIIIFAYASDGLAVANVGVTNVFFPIENGQVVIRDGAFSEVDIRDLRSLAGKLKQAKDGVSQYLISGLDKDIRKALSDYSGSSSDIKWLRDPLALELKKVVHGRPIYEPQRFADVKLSPATQALLKKNPQGEALVRLNRMLLEDAYPLEISRRVLENQK